MKDGKTGIFSYVHALCIVYRKKSQGTVFFPKSKIIKQEVYLCGQTNCLKEVLEGRPSNKLVHWFVGAQEILESWESKYALGYLHILLHQIVQI